METKKTYIISKWNFSIECENEILLNKFNNEIEQEAKNIQTEKMNNLSVIEYIIITEYKKFGLIPEAIKLNLKN